MKLSRFIIPAMVIMFFSLIGCSEKKSEKGNAASTQDAQNTLNISIFLDLSDRLTREMTPSQLSRDTAIVSYIADYFKSKTLGPQILTSKNSIKVFFYPTPNDPNIAKLAESLNLDISTLKGVEKRNGIEEMKSKFSKNLSVIYNKTISEHNWIGCDIWDFFNSKKVDVQCVKEDARNIIFILTDGYIFDAHNKIKKDKAYSYILPQTLAVEGSSLLATRKGLDNLEVMLLEINPYSKEQGYKMEPILEKWFKDMGVKKINISETDLPIHTQTVIKNFLDKK